MINYSVINGFLYTENTSEEGFWEIREDITRLFNKRLFPDIFNSFAFKRDVLKLTKLYLTKFPSVLTAPFTATGKTIDYNNIECILDFARIILGKPGNKLSPSGWASLLRHSGGIVSVGTTASYAQKQLFLNFDLELLAKRPDTLIMLWCQNSDNAIDEMITFLNILSGDYQ